MSFMTDFKHRIKTPSSSRRAKKATAASKRWQAQNPDKVKAYFKENETKIRAYRADYARRKKAQNRALMRMMKEGVPCADCEGFFPYFVLDFDHVRGAKENNVSLMASRSARAILAEADKCEVVCANCHRIRTHERGQYVDPS